jgi:DNA-binding CsgD family transcriptional regulator
VESPRESEFFLRSANGNGIRSNLSIRQLHVAQLAVSGYSNREIASELKITEQIVKNVLHSVFDKLGVWNRVELTNRLPKSGESRIAVESQRRPESERSRQFLHCETFDTKADQVLPQFNASAESGMELRDLLADPEFPFRKKRQRQEICGAAEAYRSVARVFADNPDMILKSLVEAATTFCGADSAGISLEEGDGEGPRRFRWIAISGSFAPFLGGTTPRFFSPCGTTLDRGRVQLYRVGKPYYDCLGIKADPITDGILMPWQAGEMRGTIWVISHRHREAFDLVDLKLMDGLADFAATAVENGFHQRTSQKPETMPAA